MRVFLKIKGVDDFGKQYYGKYSNGNTAHKYQHHYPKTKVGDILLYYYPKGDGTRSDNRMMLGAYKVTEEKEHYEDREGYTYESGIMKRLTGHQRQGGFSEWHLSIRKSDPKTWEFVEGLVVGALKKYNPDMILQ